MCEICWKNSNYLSLNDRRARTTMFFWNNFVLFFCCESNYLDSPVCYIFILKILFGIYLFSECLLLDIIVINLQCMINYIIIPSFIDIATCKPFQFVDIRNLSKIVILHQSITTILSNFVFVLCLFCGESIL